MPSTLQTHRVYNSSIGHGRFLQSLPDYVASTVRVGRLLTLVMLVFCSIPAWAEDAPTPNARLLARNLPGAQVGGSVLLPNQWSLRPTGRQIEVGNFPVNVALHPQGQWAVILHSGYGPHAIVVVDVTTRRIVSSVIVPNDLLWPLLLARAANGSSRAAAKTMSFTNSASPTVISTATR